MKRLLLLFIPLIFFFGCETEEENNNDNNSTIGYNCINDDCVSEEGGQYATLNDCLSVCENSNSSFLYGCTPVGFDGNAPIMECLGIDTSIVDYEGDFSALFNSLEECEQSVDCGFDDCNLSIENLLFNQLQEGMSYSDIVSIIGFEGEHYDTSDWGTGSEMRSYRWVYCDNNTATIDCDLLDNGLYKKYKSFSNGACSNNVTMAGFSSVSIGDSYEDVCFVLGGDGDIRSVTFNNSSDFNASWYGCDEDQWWNLFLLWSWSPRIDVSFDNGLVDFIYQDLD